MEKITIVGSGPVGSFMAVLCSCIGFKVTVYEKREQFTRNINLKLESSIFEEVLKVLSRLNVGTRFFTTFNENLKRQGNKILIRDLEDKFTTEAKALGAIYITREVKSMSELYDEYETPLILDCSGRNSSLRSNVLGPDEYNIVSTPLQQAMYLNFKAKVSGDMSLYQVMKYVPNIKLTEAVVSKETDSKGYSSVTIPVFITEKLARKFDTYHPQINRNPINPFNTDNPVSDSIFSPVSSLIGNLLIDGCRIDLSSVTVKKIEISCGHAKGRSRNNFVCLGDSSAHLAFFRSLNLGLKHALELFTILSRFSKEKTQSIPSNEDVVQQFQRSFPFLNPIKAYHTESRNVYLVVTKVIWYGCYSFNLTTNSCERLTYITGVYEDQVYNILIEHNHRLSSWSDALTEFERKREKDIQQEIQSNKAKSTTYDFASTFVDLNGMSIIKISEVVRAVKGQPALFQKDFEFLLKCFKTRRDVLTSNASSKDAHYVLVSVIYNLLTLQQGKLSSVLREVSWICTKVNTSSEEKLKQISFAVNRLRSRHFLMTKKFDSNAGINQWTTNNSNVRLHFISTLIKNELQVMNINFSETNPLPKRFERILKCVAESSKDKEPLL